MQFDTFTDKECPGPTEDPKDIEAWPAPHSKMVVKSFPGAEKVDHGGDGTGYDHPPDQVICGPW